MLFDLNILEIFIKAKRKTSEQIDKVSRSVFCLAATYSSWNDERVVGSWLLLIIISSKHDI